MRHIVPLLAIVRSQESGVRSQEDDGDSKPNMIVLFVLFVFFVLFVVKNDLKRSRAVR
jgi:hypothetical protein